MTEVEVTQADRELFIRIADKDDHDDEIRAGHHFTWEVSEIAAYRHAAMIEGARLMQEIAINAMIDSMVGHEWPPQDGDRQIDEVCDAIAALDPAEVVKGQP